MYFRVLCLKVLPSGDRRVVSESHRSLASALEAVLDHQQRPWQRVLLSPVLTPRQVPQQLSLLG
jgi:hypothetical protein